jgi:diketogulonate reductase-like aldo/keto reductase
LKSIGEKYGKTGPQVALRYLLQRGVIIIPKSSKKERMAQNLDLFDFTLSEEDMNAILQLDTAQPVIMPSHHSPEITKWFMSLLSKK